MGRELGAQLPAVSSDGRELGALQRRPTALPRRGLLQRRPTALPRRGPLRGIAALFKAADTDGDGRVTAADVIKTFKGAEV